MKLMQKNNIWSVFCQAFTILALGGMTLDAISHKSVNYSQFNLGMIAVGCFVAVMILYQTYRLEFLSPLAIVTIQYIAAAGIILVLVWASGFWDPVSPHGYRDALVSFSIPYVIGVIIYWNMRKKEIKRQNEELQMIKKLKDNIVPGE